MSFKKFIWAAVAAVLGISQAQAWEASVTYMPNSGITYRGEGKVIPQSYVNRFAGETSPAYRLDLTQTTDPRGYWQMTFMHTGVFGGGAYAEEKIPDNTTGGTYQINQLNVGFSNFFVTYRKPVGISSIEGLVSFSIVRQIFKRKEFIVDGTDLRATGLDDVNEISAEGLGLGLSGIHGRRFYFRWQAAAHYYVQVFDAKTDASAGHMFLAEGGTGVRVTDSLSLEGGALWQYWFILGQGNRRLFTGGSGEGAVISWNRQQTRLSGFYLRAAYRFP